MMPTLTIFATGTGTLFHKDGPLMAIAPSCDDPLDDQAWILYGLDIFEECRGDQDIEWRWYFALGTPAWHI